MESHPAPEADLEMVIRALAAQRARRGLSLTEVARRAGLAKDTVARMENGTGCSSALAVFKVAGALGIRLGLRDPVR